MSHPTQRGVRSPRSFPVSTLAAAIALAFLFAPAVASNPAASAAPGDEAPPRPLSATSLRAAELGFRDYIHWPEDLDPEDFFPVSKVRPGMRGVGKTVFEGVEIEEFEFEVLGVAHNFYSESDLVWTRLSTPRLDGIGVVAGMSGSPVYIDGKMLGAVAYGYGFSKEPIAGIQTIEQMIRVLNITDDRPHAVESGAVASNWAEARSVFERWRGERAVRLDPAEARALGLPGASDIPAAGATLEPLGMTLQLAASHPFVVEQAERYLAPHGFRVVSGMGVSGGLEADRRVLENNRARYPEAPRVADGAALAVVMMNGSMTLSGVGTITLVHGDRLVAYGHPMFGDGQVDFPMATAVIFGVMPSLARPFKMGEVFEEVGSVRQDRMPAIGGQLGFFTPKMPMTVRLDLPDVGETRHFEYEIVPHSYFGPYFAMLAWIDAIMSADRMGGPMLLENTTRLHLARGRTLERRDLLSGDTMPMLLSGYDLMGIVGALFNNPFEMVKIEKIEVEATLRQRLSLGVVLDARLEHDAYRPGEQAAVRLWLQHWRDGIEPLDLALPLPDTLEDGAYQLHLLDGSGRETLERRLRPELARPLSGDRLIDALEIAYPSNRLHLVLTRERDGLVLGDEIMPDLPGSVLSVLRQSAPPHRTTAITLERVAETEKRFDYQVGGTRRFTLTIDGKLPR